MAVEEGKKAPAFTLADENGDKVRLSELAGNWVVLYFYPRDDTPGCTVERSLTHPPCTKLKRPGNAGRLQT